MNKLSVALATLLATSTTAPLQAEVVDAGNNGFTVRHVFSVDAGRNAVYEAAVARVGEWWSDDHTMSGHASNMSIDAKPLGCFCENLGNGAGVVHMTVTFVNPSVMIRFTGGLGPLGLMGVDGNMTWEFDDDGDATRVTLNYAVGGYAAGGLDAIAPAVDSVLTEQMSRLKAYVEAEAG
jgi:Polyketide cyclase / dehydrase and lipid transport